MEYSGAVRDFFVGNVGVTISGAKDDDGGPRSFRPHFFDALERVGRLRLFPPDLFAFRKKNAGFVRMYRLNSHFPQ